jgi:amidase
VFTDLGADERLTIAVVAEPPGGATHPEIAAAVRRAGDVLSGRGHRVIEITPPNYERVTELWAMLLIADINETRVLLDLVMSDEARIVLDSMVTQYPSPTLQSSVMLQGERFKILREWSAFFAEHPVIVSPTWGQPAFEHDADIRGEQVTEIMRDTLRPVLPGNFLGIPAAVVPFGMAAGLPVGVQVMGDRFTDLRCLAIAEQIEQASEIVTPIDPVMA